MIYAKTLDVPALTLASAPVETTLPITRGVVRKVVVVVPRWACGLVWARVVYKNQVVWPSNPDQWFGGDDTTWDFEESLEIDDYPHYFRLQGYNEDDMYQHTLYFGLSILKEEPDLLSQVLLQRPTLAGLEVG